MLGTESFATVACNSVTTVCRIKRYLELFSRLNFSILRGPLLLRRLPLTVPSPDILVLKYHWCFLWRQLVLLSVQFPGQLSLKSLPNKIEVLNTISVPSATAQ